jgi:hypothetical protein
MLTTIWKFELPAAGRATFAIPGFVRFLTVGVQQDMPVIWAEVQPDAPQRSMTVEVRLTGGVRESCGAYLGTFQLRGPYVGHVFLVEQV